jgi:hypothetical protein
MMNYKQSTGGVAWREDARRMGADVDTEEKRDAEWERERLFTFAMCFPYLSF